MAPSIDKTDLAINIVVGIVGGIAVFAISYFFLTYLSFSEFSPTLIIAISAFLGALVAIFGWKAIRWIYQILDDLW